MHIKNLSFRAPPWQQVRGAARDRDVPRGGALLPRGAAGEEAAPAALSNHTQLYISAPFNGAQLYIAHH